VSTSVDARTRLLGPTEPVDPARFWEHTWPEALARHGARAALDAERMSVEPLAIAVGERAWTLRLGANGLEAAAGVGAKRIVALDGPAFSDWVEERKTAMGLAIADRLAGDPASRHAFSLWDPVLRSALDGRGIHREGEVPLRAADGSQLDLAQRFRLGEDDAEAAHFLAEAGFLLLEGVFDESEIARLDADLAAAVAAARPEDGESWWATQAGSGRYPCRVLNFQRRSALLRELFDDRRYRAIGALLDDGHVPGDSFGEHFGDPSAEGLSKRLESVEGLVCLPWHKDCERGGHSRFCSSITVGICLTPVDEDHGGLDVLAGSHRAHVPRDRVEAVDLPVATLRAARGDITLHLSCALHRSTHPQRAERRVIYTGFALPLRAGDTAHGADRVALEAERARIGDASEAGSREGASAAR